MLDQISKFLSAFGYTGGIIGLLVALFGFISKLKPITLLTSTCTEKILLSKEKRFIVTITNFCFQTLYVSLLFFGTLMYSFNLNQKHYVAISIILLTITIMGVILLILINLFEKIKIFVRSIVFSTKPLTKILTAIFYLLIIFSYISFIPYYMGSHAAALLVVDLNKTEQQTLLLSALMLSILLSGFLVGGLKLMFSTMNANRYNLYGRALFIQEQGTLKKWFIYHPTNKVHFILGDTPNPSESTVYRFIETTVLLNEKIYVYKAENV
ncbi:hypothetical protein P4H71_11590 [Paenibacillus kribbensis]|uniref:hypothetical protein n=1 Tax=Paenibacillus kribbensis TaxID=172713 RepID=UPI002DBBC7D0|nr:hypothetical protein [Paenibacillus kribbensis]MEC0234970.1 hypothetical protein [Paenibacillus kribbensis]